MFAAILLWSFLLLIIVYLLKLSTGRFDYFENRGIKFSKPYPLIGTNFWFLTRKIMAEQGRAAYNRFKGEKVYGAFDFVTPVLIPRDPEVIKKFAIKDFDHFTDHRFFLNPKQSKVQSSVLLMMKGKKWHEMRTSLSPIFTTSKMRQMFELISLCGQQLIDNLRTDKDRQYHPYDMKDICTKYTCDVIASTAFGFQCDSYKDPDNEFYDLGKSLFALRKPSMLLKMLMWRFFPILSKYLGISIFKQESGKRFSDMILDTMKTREKDHITRPDMINLLMQLKKGDLKDDDGEANSKPGTTVKRTWEDAELLGQCFTFFFAGFETVSTVLTFVTYELAINQDIQERLRDEIEEVRQQLDDKPLTYDAVQGMKYMDMVISEGLRKWPPAPVLDRVCTKKYLYKDEDGLKFEMDVGDMIWLPVYAIQRDPEYYPDPDKYDPERFSDERKHEIQPYTYLPFGIGPRNCIGNRFALMEIKTLLFYLLSNYSLEVSDESMIPLKLQPGIIGMVPEKNVLLNLKPLNKL